MVETDVDELLAGFGVTGAAAALITIVFGILVIVLPDLIALLVGVYLIIHGLIRLMEHLEKADGSRARRHRKDW